MKKSIIALAVATASLGSVAQADNTTLYGTVRVSYQYEDIQEKAKTDSATDVVKDVIKFKGSSKIRNNATRVGVKGSDDLGNGLTAKYKFELGIDKGTAVTRDQWLGLAGGFGEVRLGRFTLPFDGVMGANDNFNAVGYSVQNPEGFFSPARTSNVLAYVSPDMGGFSFTAGAVMNGYNGNPDADKKHVDAYQVTAGFNAFGLNVGLAYADALIADQDTIALSLGYSADAFSAGLVAARYNDKSDRNPMFYDIYGEYNISDMDTIRASVGMYDYDKPNTDESMEYNIGYQHKFTKRSRVWAEYSYVDMGGEADGASKVSIGLRTDF